MLCEHCPALVDMGTEETHCCLRGDDDRLEFKDGYGCRMTSESIKKKVEMSEKELSKYYESMSHRAYLDMLENDENFRDEKLGMIACMMYALRLNRAKTYTRNGIVFKKPYRNYFAVTRKCDVFDFCRYAYNAGLMSCPFKDMISEDPDEMLYFHVTKDGIKWIERMQHCRINTTEIKEELK